MNKGFYKGVIVMLCLAGFSMKAQTVGIYKIDDLLKRVYNNSDTTYIINFWATWCKPCVEELPEFEAFHQAHQGQAVKVILVSMDFKEDLDKKLIPFLKKMPHSSEVILLDEINGNDFINKVHAQWSGAIPATLITSKNKHKLVLFERKITLRMLENELR